jgi:hypothetical protein
MSTRRRRGLALVELLLLAGMAMVSLGLLATAIQEVHEAAERMQCANNLKQLAMASHNLHDTYGFVPSNPDTLVDHFGTVQYLLLPYMD